MGYSGAGGKLIDEKNQKRKISWHFPFNILKDENKYWFVSKIRGWRYLVHKPVYKFLSTCHKSSSLNGYLLPLNPTHFASKTI